MTTHAIEILPAQPNGHAIGVHGLDDETKALLGYLARYTGATLKQYENDMRLFREWAARMGCLRLLTAERYLLELYVRHMSEDCGQAPSTVRRKFGTVRGFYTMAHNDGIIARNPAAGVRLPKIEHTQQYRTWFETIDIAQILRDTTDPRDGAVLQMMFDLALRVGELCALDVDSIRYESDGTFVRFIGKGGKPANMAIPPACLRRVEAYLAGRTTGPLFLNDWGNRLTRPNVQTIIDRVSKACGITYRVTPHGPRRSHARMVIQNGGSYDDAADNLRHSDSRVTKTSYAVGTGAGDLGRLRISAAMAAITR